MLIINSPQRLSLNVGLAMLARGYKWTDSEPRSLTPTFLDFTLKTTPVPPLCLS